MINKDDIEAFSDEKESVATRNASSLAKHIFRYEQSSFGNPDMSFTVFEVDKPPGNLLMVIGDDLIGEKISVLVPNHAIREMINAMEKVLK